MTRYGFHHCCYCRRRRRHRRRHLRRRRHRCRRCHCLLSFLHHCLYQILHFCSKFLLLLFHFSLKIRYPHLT